MGRYYCKPYLFNNLFKIPFDIIELAMSIKITYDLQMNVYINVQYIILMYSTLTNKNKLLKA